MEKEIELEQEAIVVYSGGGAVNSVNGYTGDVVLTTSDLENTSDYQTGAQVQNAIAGKQDKLTAGANIQINNNTISATDTTYSAFTGTDGQTAGTAGLVPAPATTDADKFLKSDGTWATVSGGGGGTTNYNSMTNKPSINGVELIGNKSLEDLGISGVTEEQLDEAIDDETTAREAADTAINGRLVSTGIFTQRHNGHMSSDNPVWVQTTQTSWKYYVIPIKPGDVVKTSFERAITIGFLKSYTPPTADNTPIDYSSNTGFTNYIVAGVAEREWIVPDDCNYLVVENYRNNVEIAIIKLEVNGYELVDSLRSNVEKALIGHEAQSSMTRRLLDWELGAFNTGTGEAVSSSTRIRSAKIDASNGVYIGIPAGLKLFLLMFQADGTYIGAIGALTDSFYHYPVRNEGYIRLFGGYTNNRNIDSVVNVGLLFNISFVNALDNSPLIYALGDSITEGYYSYINNGTGTMVKSEHSYINYAMALRRGKVINFGIGGTGYSLPGQSINAKDLADLIDFSAADCVTLAYGVNDWKGNVTLGTMDSTVGDSSIVGSMRYVIEKIISDNPTCKIFVITPLNCVGYSKNYGSEATNWALGYRFTNSGTLNDVFNAMKEVAEYYGLQLIDQTHTSIVNRKNILAVLPDGVHPSIKCQKQLGREIAAKLTFA